MKMWNKLRFVIGILLLINLVACIALPGEKSPDDISSTAPAISLESPTVSGSQSWVIFTKEHAEEMGIASWMSFGDDFEGFWTPSTDDVLKLEEGIAEYLRQNSGAFYRQPPVWERLEEYQRQYIGLELKEGRVIYGNYFCSSQNAHWQQKFVMVLDGGDCYFQVEYDVENGLFIELRVNGES